MISHIWTVITRGSIVDASTNLISLHNILEKIDVDIQGTPPKDSPIIVPIDFEVVSLWADDDIEKQRQFDVRVELINTEKKVTGEFQQTMTLEKNIRRFRSILKINGLPITKSGIYYFKIYVKSAKETKFPKPVAQIPLEVNITLHPQIKPANS